MREFVIAADVNGHIKSASALAGAACLGRYGVVIAAFIAHSLFGFLRAGTDAHGSSAILARWMRWILRGACYVIIRTSVYERSIVSLSSAFIQKLLAVLAGSGGLRRSIHAAIGRPPAGNLKPEADREPSLHILLVLNLEC